MSEGDELEITGDALVNRTTGKSFPVVSLPKARQTIIDAGGLMAYTRRRVLEAAKARSSGRLACSVSCERVATRD